MSDSEWVHLVASLVGIISALLLVKIWLEKTIDEGDEGGGEDEDGRGLK